MARRKPDADRRGSVPHSRRLTVARCIAVACLSLLLLGQFGRIDDRFDAINFALPYLFAMGLIASLAGLRAERGGALLLAGAIAAASAPLLIGETALERTAPCGGPVLHLAQYNAFKDNADPAAAARWLILARPDVIVLEEGTRLVPLLAPFYRWRQGCAQAGGCSTIILSRHRPRAGGGAAIGDPENRGALSAAWMRLAGQGAEFTVVGVHLGRPWPFHAFAGERRLLRALVPDRGRATTIIAGDFNLPGWTFQMRRLEVALGLSRVTRWRRSWPGRPLPLLGIDHVLAGAAWRPLRTRVGPALGSDHRPVLVTLERCDARHVSMPQA